MADVALHYDLPKDLFAAVVSANSYSATRHRLAPDHPVEAHRRHYRAILQEVLPDGGHILDLGCGWGGLLDVALEDDRNSVAAVTISGAQAQAVELGHADEIARNRLRLVNGDFTQLDLLPTKVDALAMIESIEHLGPALRTPFLRDLRDRYPGAPLVVQATTKAGRGAEARSRERGALVDVVFPGPGMLPTVRQLRRELIAARYELIRTYDLTSEYVSTALRWMQGFGSEADEGGDVAPIARLFQAYAAATAASLDRGMARNVVIISRPKER